MAFLLLILCIPSFAHAQRKEKKNTVNELIPIDCEDIVFSRDGRSILILEDDVNDFSIWDLQRNRLIKKVEVRRTLGDEHFSLGAQHVVARINPPDALCFLDISTGSFQIAKAPGSLEVDQISLNGKVEWLKDRGSHQLLRILSAPFDESSPSKTVELQGLENSFNDIQFMEFSPNGRVFAGRVRHEPGTFSLWDCATGKKIAQLPDAGLYFSNFGKDEYGFSPDGSVFYLMHRSRVELYDASDGHVIGGLQGQLKEGRPEYIRFSPDSKLIYGENNRNEHFIWIAQTGKLKCKIDSKDFSWHAFNDEAQQVVSFDEKTVKFYSTTSGKLVNSLSPPSELDFAESQIYKVSPDGKRLVDVNYSGDLLIWDFSTNKVSKLGPIMSEISLVALEPGSQLVFEGGTKAFIQDKNGKRRRAIDGHYKVGEAVILIIDGEKMVSP